MKSLHFIATQSFLHWINLTLAVIFFSGTLVLINVIAYQHNRRFDLTPEKKFSLSPQTIRILNGLTDDLEVTVFYNTEARDQKRSFEDLLGLFARASNYFHYSFVDLDKNPAKARNFGIRSYGAGLVQYQNKKETFQYLTEENLLSAILFFSKGHGRVVRFLEGHGEKDITSADKKNGYSSIRRALELENYKTTTLLLMQEKKIPEDTTVLVVSGPEKDLLQQELDLIDKYLKSGGRVLFLCDPYPLPKVERYFKKLNIALDRDFIIDQKSRLFELDELTPIIVPDKRHPITNRMNDVVVFPLCRSVQPLQQQGGAGIALDILAYSGPESWAERNTQSVYDENPQFDRGDDIQGPIPVALVAQIQARSSAPEQKNDNGIGELGRLVVMGDADFIANHYIDILGNKDFFLNVVSWLAERKELIATRPKSGQASSVSMLFLTENENKLILWSTVMIEPALILLIGITVVYWRRLRR